MISRGNLIVRLIAMRVGIDMTIGAQPDDEKVLFSELFDAAREIIRAEGHACIVGSNEVFDGLEEKYGDKFRVSSDTHQVLALICALWDDPHVDPVTGTGDIEFAWNELGYYPKGDPALGLLAATLRQKQEGSEGCSSSIRDSGAKAGRDS